jgi:hypothetical protein
MKTAFGILGWILAATVLLGLTVLAFHEQELQIELGQQLEYIEKIQGQLQSARLGLEDAQQTIVLLETRIGELEGLVSQAAPGDVQDEPTAETALPALENLLSRFQQQQAGAGGESQRRNPMEFMRSMYEGEEGQRLVEYSTDMQFNMQYGTLNEWLQLPDERLEAVNGIIRQHLRDQMTQGMAMFSEGFDRDKARQLHEEAGTTLRDALSEVLTPVELSQWDDFESTAQTRMMTQQYEMQLSMMAPGIRPDTREYIVAVLAEELQAASGGGAHSPFDFNENLGRQHTAFTRTLERVHGQIDDDQYRQLESFIRRQEDMAQVFMRIWDRNGEQP